MDRLAPFSTCSKTDVSSPPPYPRIFLQQYPGFLRWGLALSSHSCSRSRFCSRRQYFHLTRTHLLQSFQLTVRGKPSTASENYTLHRETQAKQSDSACNGDCRDNPPSVPPAVHECRSNSSTIANGVPVTVTDQPGLKRSLLLRQAFASVQRLCCSGVIGPPETISTIQQGSGIAYIRSVICVEQASRQPRAGVGLHRWTRHTSASRTGIPVMPNEDVFPTLVWCASLLGMKDGTISCS